MLTAKYFLYFLFMRSIKHIVALSLQLVLLCACQRREIPRPPSNRQLYIWSGQSNAVGYAVYAPVIYEGDDPRITMFKNGSWQTAQNPISPEPGAGMSSGISFAKQMLALNPSTPIGLINCAVGSTIIDEWQPGPPPPYYPDRFKSDYPTGLLNNCYEQIDAALRADPTTSVAGFLFVQGESDANVCGGNSPWALWMQRLAADVRGRYHGIPVVYAQLGPFLPSSPQCATDAYVESFRAEQASAQGPGLSMIVTKDLTVIPSGVHFTSESLQAVGQRMALKISPWNPDNQPYTIHVRF